MIEELTFSVAATIMITYLIWLAVTNDVLDIEKIKRYILKLDVRKKKMNGTHINYKGGILKNE